MEPILKSQFAARLKVSKARVSQMVQMGMPQTPDGRINVPDALQWIEQHINPIHRDSLPRRMAAAAEAAGAPAPPEASKPPEAPAPPLAVPPGMRDGLPDPAWILLSAKAKRALVELRKAEREERKESGELIEVEEMARIIEDLIANTKARLLSLGFRLAPRLAGETDAGRCTAMIDSAVREALEELSSIKVAA